MWYSTLVSTAARIPLCPGHHVSPPDPLQTPRISPPRACPLIKLFALPFFSITYELPNLQALCFDIHTTCRGCGGSRTCSRLPTTLLLHLCESLCSRCLCVISFPSLSPVTSHESPACPEFRGATAFKLFGIADFFCISVAAHEQKLALLY